MWRTGARISNQNFNFVRKQTCIPFFPPFTMNPPSPPRRVVTAGGWGQAAESPALLSQRCPHPCPRPQQGHSLPVLLLVLHGLSPRHQRAAEMPAPICVPCLPLLMLPGELLLRGGNKAFKRGVSRSPKCLCLHSQLIFSCPEAGTSLALHGSAAGLPAGAAVGRWRRGFRINPARPLGAVPPQSLCQLIAMQCHAGLLRELFNLIGMPGAARAPGVGSGGKAELDSPARSPRQSRRAQAAVRARGTWMLKKGGCETLQSSFLVEVGTGEALPGSDLLSLCCGDGSRAAAARREVGFPAGGIVLFPCTPCSQPASSGPWVSPAVPTGPPDPTSPCPGLLLQLLAALGSEPPAP